MATGENSNTTRNAEKTEPESAAPGQSLNDHEIAENPSESMNSEPRCSPSSIDPNSQSDEVSGNREQKLKRIREAVVSGYYDSDELLDLAMTRMIERLRNSP